MKNIFENILARLEAEVPELNWVDLQKGQMNYSRPPILFPAALIKIRLPKTENVNTKRQRCNALIIVDLCFDYTGNTDSTTPQTARDESLKYFDIKQKVYEKLQGFGTVDMNPLERIGEDDPERPDAYKVGTILFTTSYIDATAV